MAAKSIGCHLTPTSPYERDSPLAKLVAVTPPRLAIRPNDPVLAITLPT